MSDDLSDCSLKLSRWFAKILLCLLSGILCFNFSIARKHSDHLPKSIPKPSKIKMLWLDSEQDVFLLSNPKKVADVLDKCVQAGVNSIAIDIKPYSGYVLYNSKIAPKLTAFKGNPYPEKYDLLQTVIKEGHKRGLEVHAAINVFSEGLKAEKEGPVFANPGWECVVYDVTNFILADNLHQQPLTETNQRTTNNTLVIYTPDYGKKLFRSNEPGNVTDGNLESPSSRWVSGHQKTTHWISLEWTTPVKIDTLQIFMVKNHILSDYRIQSWQGGEWIDLTTIKNNKDINPTHYFKPVTTRKLRIYIDDPGIDSIARIQEIKAFSLQGNSNNENLAEFALTNADSFSSHPGNKSFFIVRNNVVEEVVEPDEYPAQGLDIPEDGYIISAHGAVRAWAESNLIVGTTLERGVHSRLVRETEKPGGTLVFVNPANPEVRERALSILREVVKNYNVDGIILDRVQYDNFQSDFSPLSRNLFEQFIGQKIQRWPEDIYQMVPTSKGYEIQPGPYYREWIYWRASIIKNFIVDARTAIKEIKPKVIFADHVGGWYPDYYSIGANWASYKYDPSRDYDWATPAYRGTGYAEYLDALLPGLYYPDITARDAVLAGKKDYASMEGGLKILDKVIGNSIPVYASLYYPNLAKPDTFKKAVNMSLSETNGVMIFSMYYFETQNKWDLLSDALKEPIANKEVKISQIPNIPTSPSNLAVNPIPSESFSLRSIFRVPMSWFTQSR